MLTDAAIRKAKPRESQYKLTDEKGLYVLVRPNGSKLWQLKYRFGGKEKSLSFGPYPEVSLADARSCRDAARTDLRAGIDPGISKLKRRVSAAETEKKKKRKEKKNIGNKKIENKQK